MRINLDINKYTDYRAFLKSYAELMKKKNPSWSLGAWAQALNLKTTSSITKILKGERDAGAAITDKLIFYFKFNNEQERYFRDLVRLQKVKKDPMLANILLEKINTLKSDEISRDLPEEDCLLLSNWYYLALCEMSRNKSFKNNSKWISSKLLPKVTPEEVKSAIKVLKKERLIQIDKNGRMTPSYERLYAINKKNSEILKLYYLQLIQYSQQALLTVPPADRHFSSLVVHMSSKSLERANQLIIEFRSKFEKLMYDSDGDKVYLMQVQLFPMTKKLDELVQ